MRTHLRIYSFLFGSSACSLGSLHLKLYLVLGSSPYTLLTKSIINAASWFYFGGLFGCRRSRSDEGLVPVLAIKFLLSTFSCTCMGLTAEVCPVCVHCFCMSNRQTV